MRAAAVGFAKARQHPREFGHAVVFVQSMHATGLGLSAAGNHQVYVGVGGQPFRRMS